MKDVATLADAGELTDMFKSVRELNRHLNLTIASNDSALTATLKNGKRAA